MGHVIINTGPVIGREVPVSTAAADMVRMKFNPSGSEDVDTLKSLAAAFVSVCADLSMEAAEADHASACREFAVAQTQMQTACMFAVAAATPRL
ncbi:MAG: hypothetical protein MRY77_14500 [Rhodobacteraceae bacterium]|nr:hypothetical protein [Paracoccaceae bacterium]